MRNIVFDWTNAHNGRLLGFIGILSTILQGGYVRRAIAKTGEITMARRGVSSCVISLCLLSALPFLTKGDNIVVGVRVMYLAAAFLAFTSATVVNSLTALASLQCDEVEDDKKEAKPVEYPELAKGRALGEFRSSGQLGRAVGPLLGTCFRPCVYYLDSDPTVIDQLVRLIGLLVSFSWFQIRIVLYLNGLLVLSH